MLIGPTPTDWSTVAFLPATTVVTLGDATANTSGNLVLGGPDAILLQEFAGLLTDGPGGSVFGGTGQSGNDAGSLLYLNIADGVVNTFAGNLGGSHPQYPFANRLTLHKGGPGTLVLTGTNTYIGATWIDNGTVEIASFGNAIAGALGGTEYIQTSGYANNPITFRYKGTGETINRRIWFALRPRH